MCVWRVCAICVCLCVLVSLPLGAMGWSVIYDCGIRPYSVTADLKICPLVRHLTLTLFKRGDVNSVTQKYLTTSLVVTCDSVNSLLGNHMKCFNIAIFNKLIFSVKVLM